MSLKNIIKLANRFELKINKFADVGHPEMYQENAEKNIYIIINKVKENLINYWSQPIQYKKLFNLNKNNKNNKYNRYQSPQALEKELKQYVINFIKELNCTPVDPVELGNSKASAERGNVSIFGEFSPDTKQVRVAILPPSPSNNQQLTNTCTHEISHAVEDLLSRWGLYNENILKENTRAPQNVGGSIPKTQRNKDYALSEKEQYARLMQVRDYFDIGATTSVGDFIQKLQSKIPNLQISKLGVGSPSNHNYGPGKYLIPTAWMTDYSNLLYGNLKQLLLPYFLGPYGSDYSVYDLNSLVRSFNQLAMTNDRSQQGNARQIPV
jgi:hypothetical protein